MIDKLYITHAGRRLSALAHAGEPLRFTRVELGEGALPDGQDIAQLTALISPVMSRPIAGILPDENKATINVQISNAELSRGFSFAEIGIWAVDPEGGEALYAVGNAGTNADWMPTPDVAPMDYLLALMLTVGGADNVHVNYDASLIWMTKQEGDALRSDLKAALEHVHEISDVADLQLQLDGKQSKIERFTGQLMPDAWQGSAAPYTQTVPIAPLLQSDTPIVDLTASADYETALREDKGWAHIYRITTQEGSVTAYAKKKTDVALNFMMKVVR